MTTGFYPALHASASQAASRAQRRYLALIATEYGLLVVAAILSMSLFTGATFYTLYACVFLASAAVLLTRALQRPESDWYDCRALAESLKTLTWRYVMRAEPFAGGEPAARAVFRDALGNLTATQRRAIEKMAPDAADAEQFTPEMDRLRALPLADRKGVYLQDRVRQQRSWYASKARTNKRNSRTWLYVAVVAYGVAVVLTLSRIQTPTWEFWPIEPVIVFASSVLGWSQTRRFNELAAAYTTTAHEIGLVQPCIEDASDDAAFSDAVNEAELAFSREHTHWTARRRG